MNDANYSAPRLLDLGTVAEMTQVGCSNDLGDAMPGDGCEGGSVFPRGLDK